MLNVTFFHFQVVAGFQDDDEQGGGMDVDSSAKTTTATGDAASGDNEAVQKLSTKVSQVIGWSDMYLVKHTSPAKVVS